MMRILILIVLLHISCLGIGRPLYDFLVKVNTAECYTCYAYMTFLNQIDNGYNIKLIFQESCTRPEAFIKKYVPDLTISYTIISSDSIYNSMNHFLESECLIMSQEKDSIFACNIKELNQNLLRINSIPPVHLEIEIDTKLPDSIYFRNGVACSETEHQILLTESFTNTQYLLSKESLALERTITIDSHDAKEIYKEVFGNNMVYTTIKKNEKKLKNFHKDKPIIGISTSLGDTVFSIVELPYMEFDTTEKGIYIDVKAKIILIKWSGDKYKIYNLIKPEQYEISYYCFFIRDGKFYLSIRPAADSSEKYILARYNTVDDRVVPEKLLPVKLPEFQMKYELKYSLLNFKNNNGVVLFNYAPDVIDMDQGVVRRLPFKTEGFSLDRKKLKVTYSYLYLAHFVTDDEVFLLHKIGEDNVYLSCFSRNNLIRKFSKEVTNHQEALNFISQLMLIDEHTLVFLNKDYEMVQYKLTY